LRDMYAAVSRDWPPTFSFWTRGCVNHSSVLEACSENLRFERFRVCVKSEIFLLEKLKFRNHNLYCVTDITIALLRNILDIFSLMSYSVYQV
jgi:hypothetical protein